MSKSASDREEPYSDGRVFPALSKDVTWAGLGVAFAAGAGGAVIVVIGLTLLYGATHGGLQ